MASHRASSTFCWLPPERLRTSASGLPGRMAVEGLDVGLRELVLLFLDRRNQPRSAQASRCHRAP